MNVADLKPELLFPEEDVPYIGRPPITIWQYIDAGKAQDILFLGIGGSYDPATKKWLVGKRPRSVKTTTTWYCPNCTRGQIRKSYFSLTQFNCKGCRCQNQKSLQRDEYLEVAQHYGITWIPEHDLLPHNVRVRTRWLSAEGNTFWASKWELDDYGQPPRKTIREHIKWQG